MWAWPCNFSHLAYYFPSSLLPFLPHPLPLFIPPSGMFFPTAGFSSVRSLSKRPHHLHPEALPDHPPPKTKHSSSKLHPITLLYFFISLITL